MPAPAESAAPTALPAGLRDAGPVERPAGFWRRAAAWIVDIALLSPLLYALCRGPVAHAVAAALGVLGAVQDWMLARILSGANALSAAPNALTLARELLADPAMHAQVLDASSRIGADSVQVFVRAALAAALYFIAFEAGPWSATPGKRALGLRVVDLDGRPVRVGRAGARFFAGALSWLTLNLGHALAGFRRDHRALHDLVAATQVLGRGPTPRWARPLLVLVVGVTLLLPFALAARVLLGMVP